MRDSVRFARLVGALIFLCALVACEPAYPTLDAGRADVASIDTAPDSTIDAGCSPSLCDRSCGGSGAAGGVCRLGICVCIGADASQDSPDSPAILEAEVDVVPTDSVSNDVARDQPPDSPAPCPDFDGDEVGSVSCGGIDCNDRDPNIHPGAPPRCIEGMDSDCNGVPDIQGDPLRLDSYCAMTAQGMFWAFNHPPRCVPSGTVIMRYSLESRTQCQACGMINFGPMGLSWGCRCWSDRSASFPCEEVP